MGSGEFEQRTMDRSPVRTRIPRRWWIVLLGAVTPYLLRFDESQQENIIQEVPVVDSLMMSAAWKDLVCEKNLNESREIFFRFRGPVSTVRYRRNGSKLSAVYLCSNGAAREDFPEKSSLLR